MRCNCALWDRVIRFFIGVLLTTYALIGGPFWSYFGIYFIATSGWGFCPVYAYFKFKTIKSKNKKAKV